MNKLAGTILIITGVLLVLISILALIKGFDTFSSMDKDAVSVGYAMGSILFPLLLTVSGRWVIRKGRAFLRNNTD